ncbi:MAG: DUF2147 domain-containing protein [Sphingomonas sp.]|uniref:DUF2147 domain-containing protein n=1 Tax=Sphingomonas sp. TaxID=28214 RepID=UPI0012017A4E|nr:DUF2147 domain-containing protein [Sphingomonas sp.]THD37988.1 MAG: DUF2147 domain-containing protein [Sphingomonas sp.]
MIRYLSAALLLVGATAAFAAQPIAGRWLTADGSAVVAIGPCGPTLCGKIVRVLKVSAGPDGAVKARQAIGVVILAGLVPDGDGWKGSVLDPKSGKKYNARVTRDGGKLNVQGCVSVFCKTLVWTATR